MPATCTVDETLSLLVLRCHGTLTEQDFDDLTARMLEPDARACTKEVCDLRQVTSVAISPDYLRNQAHFWQGQTSLCKIADVTSTTLSFGMARLFQSHRDEDGVELRVFTTAADAEKWLDIPEGYLDGDVSRD